MIIFGTDPWFRRADVPVIGAHADGVGRADARVHRPGYIAPK